MKLTALDFEFYSNRSCDHERKTLTTGPGSVAMGTGQPLNPNLELVPEKFTTLLSEPVGLNVIHTSLTVFYSGLVVKEIAKMSENSNFCFLHESGRGGYYPMVVKDKIYHVPCAHIDTVVQLVVFEKGGFGNMKMFPSSIVIAKKVKANSRLVDFKLFNLKDAEFTFPFSTVGDVSNLGAGKQFRLGMCRQSGIVEFAFDGLQVEMPLIEHECVILALNNADVWCVLDVVSERRPFLLSLLFGRYSFECSGPKIIYGVSFQFVVREPISDFVMRTKLSLKPGASFDDDGSDIYKESVIASMPNVFANISQIFAGQNPATIMEHNLYTKPQAIIKTAIVDNSRDLRVGLIEIMQNNPGLMQTFLAARFPYSAVELYKYVENKLESRCSDFDFFHGFVALSNRDLEYSNLMFKTILVEALVPKEGYTKSHVCAKDYPVHLHILDSGTTPVKHFSSILKIGMTIRFSLFNVHECRKMFPYYIPVSNKFCDLLTIVNGLSQVHYPFMVLYDVFRVLRQGGILLIQDNEVKNSHDLDLLRLDRKTCSLGSLKNYFDMDELAEMLTFIGFEAVKTLYSNPVTGKFVMRAIRAYDSRFADVGIANPLNPVNTELSGPIQYTDTDGNVRTKFFCPREFKYTSYFDAASDGKFSIVDVHKDKNEKSSEFYTLGSVPLVNKRENFYPMFPEMQEELEAEVRLRDRIIIGLSSQDKGMLDEARELMKKLSPIQEKKIVGCQNIV